MLLVVSLLTDLTVPNKCLKTSNKCFSAPLVKVSGGWCRWAHGSVLLVFQCVVFHATEQLLGEDQSPDTGTSTETRYCPKPWVPQEKQFLKPASEDPLEVLFALRITIVICVGPMQKQSFRLPLLAPKYSGWGKERRESFNSNPHQLLKASHTTPYICRLSAENPLRFLSMRDTLCNRLDIENPTNFK